MRWTSFGRATSVLFVTATVLLTFACQSQDETIEAGDPPAQAEGPAVLGGVPTEQPPAPQDPNALLDAAVQGQELQEQKRQALVNDSLRLGNRLLAEGRAAEALKQFEKALELDPANRNARDGAERAYVLLGRPGAEARVTLGNALAKRSRAQAMADDAFQKGAQLAADGRYDEAVRKYELGFQVLDANPLLDDAFSRKRLERELQNVRQMATQAQRDREAERKEQVIRAREEREKRERERIEREVAGLFDDALHAFELERFADCERICARILTLDYAYEPAERLKEEARTARHQKRNATNIMTYREQWRNALQQVRSIGRPYGEDPVYPSYERWQQIMQRGPILASPEAAEESAADADVRRLLENTVVPLEDTIETVSDLVAFMRNSVPGVTFLATASALDAEVNVGPFAGISAGNLLATAFSAEGSEVGYVVRDGVVRIGLRGSLEETTLEFFDIRDLVAKINSFPGEDLNLSPSGGAGGGLLGMEDGGFGDEEAGGIDEEAAGVFQTLVDSVIGESGNATEVRNGTLVSRNTPANQRKIRRLLEDLRRSTGIQVQIQTRFVSVENNFLQDIGVDFRGLGDDSGGVGLPGRGASNIIDDFGPTGSPNLAIGNGNDVGAFYSKEVDLRGRTENLFDLALGNSDVLTSSGGLSLQWTYLDDTQVEAILRAVQKYERVNEVTSPSLTVMNGQRANLQVTREIAYVKDFDVEIAQASVIADPVVDLIREGVVLDVKPIVHSDRRFVTLELRPTVATLQRPIRLFSSTLGIGTAVTFEVPELRKEALKTTVVMPDGGTLLLGGLKFYEEQDYVSGVPVLKDIPLLSFLFSRKGKYTNIRDLIVLLKVRILIMEEHEPGQGI
jgi:type II secretory pathway component GspD/PulD (secretin)/tetratricopeptide (TPR) repeat protein